MFSVRGMFVLLDCRHPSNKLLGRGVLPVRCGTARAGGKPGLCACMPHVSCELVMCFPCAIVLCFSIAGIGQTNCWAGVFCLRGAAPYVLAASRACVQACRMFPMSLCCVVHAHVHFSLWYGVPVALRGLRVSCSRYRGSNSWTDFSLCVHVYCLCIWLHRFCQRYWSLRTRRKTQRCLQSFANLFGVEFSDSSWEQQAVRKTL